MGYDNAPIRKHPRGKFGPRDDQKVMGSCKYIQKVMGSCKYIVKDFYLSMFGDNPKELQKILNKLRKKYIINNIVPISSSYIMVVLTKRK